MVITINQRDDTLVTNGVTDAGMSELYKKMSGTNNTDRPFPPMEAAAIGRGFLSSSPLFLITHTRLPLSLSAPEHVPSDF